VLHKVTVIAEHGQVVTCAVNKATSKKRGTRVGSIANSIETIREFTRLVHRSGRALWLVPMMAVLMLVAGLLAFIQIVEYVAPFVYTIF
jgi:hypothetical protein